MIQLTNDQRKKIWLISDTILYPEAVAFMRELAEQEGVKQLPKNNQMMGLLNLLKNEKYDNVIAYIKRQIERNVDRVFYEKLHQALLAMQRKRIQEEFQLAVPRPTKGEENMEKKELLLLLTREFVQHIIAEHGMLQANEKRNRKKWLN